MDNEAKLVAEIESFVESCPDNFYGVGGYNYFDKPIVGFSSALDPLYEKYKTIIGDFHLTPKELFEVEHGEGAFSVGTVISWILPIARETRRSNSAYGALPSPQWAHTRYFGEQFNDLIRHRVIAVLSDMGARSVAPLHSPAWKYIHSSPVGLASTWSERHAAYVAGLGTFSLSDGFITRAGIAHRIGSVVTELSLAPTHRSGNDHLGNCLVFKDKECGICIERCPAGAISLDGHDKNKCKDYSYGTVLKQVKDDYGVKVSGCGLCQVGVPCESCIPGG